MHIVAPWTSQASPSSALELPQGRLMIQIFHTFLNAFFLSKKQQKKRAPNFHSISHFLMAILPPPKRTTSAQTTNTQLLTLGEIKEKSSNCYTNLCTNFVQIVCVHKYCCKWGVHVWVCVCVCLRTDRFSSTTTRDEKGRGKAFTQEKNTTTQNPLSDFLSSNIPNPARGEQKQIEQLGSYRNLVCWWSRGKKRRYWRWWKREREREREQEHQQQQQQSHHHHHHHHHWKQHHQHQQGGEKGLMQNLPNLESCNEIPLLLTTKEEE